MSHIIETRLHRARGHLYRIQLVQDPDPMPPWDGDALPPVAYITGADRGRDITERTSKGEHIMPSLAGASPDQLRKIADAMGMDWESVVQEAADYEGIEDPSDVGDDTARALFDRIADLLSESLSDFAGSRSDQLQAIAAAWRAIGVDADVFASTGSCQSDWAEILVILHPAWAARVGWTGDDAAARELSAITWGASLKKNLRLQISARKKLRKTTQMIWPIARWLARAGDSIRPAMQTNWGTPGSRPSPRPTPMP